MSTFFISDLHLDPHHPEIVDIFLRFLAEISHPNNALYVLGDFFETWIGDDDINDFNQKIITALQKATGLGLPIYWMHGNRDFLIGKNFLENTGCQFLPDEIVINLYGKKVLLMHGDTLCTFDKKYLLFRKITHHFLFKKIISTISLIARRKLADKLRNASRAHTKNIEEYKMDVNESEVSRLLKKYQVDHLIHGHTHKPAILPNRTILAAWHEKGNALVCDENGKWELTYF